MNTRPQPDRRRAAAPLLRKLKCTGLLGPVVRTVEAHRHNRRAYSAETGEPARCLLPDRHSAARVSASQVGPYLLEQPWYG